jgi:hypothetical protein
MSVGLPEVVFTVTAVTAVVDPNVKYFIVLYPKIVSL